MITPPEWAIRCPWCNAPVGQRCTSPRGRRLSITSHDARHTAWTDRQADQNRQTGDDQ